MQNTELRRSDLEEADFDKTRLEGAIFSEAVLEGCRIYNSHLESTSFRNATVDHKTRIFDCSIDRYTDFTGVGIDATQIEPGLKAALKDNIRRIHWQRWLDKERKKSKWIAPWLWPWPVKLFWWVTDYGSSTKRIIGTFFALASAFCLIYWLFAMIPGSQSVIDELRQVPGPDRSTAPITFGCMHTLARAFYFSVVTMTTLGFGDMHAAKTGGWPSYAGYFFLSIQVIIGYVLLGALITRLGILFTGEAPAVELSPEKAKGNKDD